MQTTNEVDELAPAVEDEMVDLVEETDESREQDEPLDINPAERRLVTQPYDYSVETLVQRVNSKKLILDIDYQRKYVWDDAKASRLIESLLLNVPVPVCYFAEVEDAKHEVIDGLQRINSLHRFLNNEFSLRGISVLKEFERLSFDQLPSKARTQLENRTVRCIVITEESHPDIKFDVFERLNTGSVQLSAQELRNCIYRGPLNEQLKQLAEDPDIRKVMGGKANSRMRDEELILRFFTLREVLADYRPPLRQRLNEFMRKHAKSEVSDSEVNVLRATMQVVGETLGDSAFAVPGKDGKVHNPVNKAMFDAISLAFSYADWDVCRREVRSLSSLRGELLGDEDFLASVGRATADRKRMFERVGQVVAALEARGVPVDLSLPEE